jgi:hypothetical protein
MYFCWQNSIKVDTMRRHELPRQEVQQVSLPSRFTFCLQVTFAFSWVRVFIFLSSGYMLIMWHWTRGVWLLPLLLLHDMLNLCNYVTISSCCFICCQVRQVCINCGVCMGKYFCGLCKLFDDDVSKRKLGIVSSVCFM